MFCKALPVRVLFGSREVRVLLGSPREGICEGPVRGPRSRPVRPCERARPGGSWGAYRKRRPKSFIDSMLRRILRGRPKCLSGSGLQIRVYRVNVIPSRAPFGYLPCGEVTSPLGVRPRGPSLFKSCLICLVSLTCVSLTRGHLSYAPHRSKESQI